ncbi:MAG: hypothetical protein NZM44_06845 [Candidatus Calescibacterium sp.]|nr:hypothetical protein [Candidatus Calescibacterium sp.]
MSYRKDREFTNLVHHKALVTIYSQLNWTQIETDKNLSEWLDINIGFDYIFINQNNTKLFIQERFRDKNYLEYNDFTIRYRRDYSTLEERRLSEFYKIKADFLVYGIINAGKDDVLRSRQFDFVKYIVIDLRFLFCLIRSGYIKITDNIDCSKIENGVLYCPIKLNRDRSSSFIVFEVSELAKLIEMLKFNLNECIILEKGFLKQEL